MTLWNAFRSLMSSRWLLVVALVAAGSAVMGALRLETASASSARQGSAAAQGKVASSQAARLAAATSWTVTAGVQSPAEDVQALAFLPSEIWVNQGDNVTWTFDTDEPHTVSFFADNQYDLPRPPFQFATKSPDNFDYTGPSGCAGSDICVNSGALQSGQSYSATLDLAPGDYTYVCLIHAYMTGTVHVQAAGSDYPHTQAFYSQEAQDQAAPLLSQGAQAESQEQQDVASDRSQNTVTVGAGFINKTPNDAQDQSVLISRFLPSRPLVQVHVGDTVTWTAQDPATPHTITFGAGLANNDPNTPLPVNLSGSGQTTLSSPYPDLYSGDTVSSGFMGKLPGPPVGRPSQGTSFSVTFNAPGTYQYFCLLHDDEGMVGQVIVTQ